MLRASDEEIWKSGGDAMPWQKDVLDVACEIDPATGLYWFRNIVLIVPRQAGKTSLSRGKVAHRCLTDTRPVLYTAQDRNKSLRRLQKDFYEPLSRSPLAQFLGRPRWSNGSEVVRWKSGAEIFIDAPTKKSGAHGETIPEAHIDEAFAHVDARIDQGVSPTMITVKGAQKWITSAAGNSESHFLWSKVEAGRARIEALAHDPIKLTESRTCYVEYSAPETADPNDPKTWEGNHPAVGHTIDLSDLAAENESLDADEFNRAYNGWWPRAEAVHQVIPAGPWEATTLGEDEETWDGTPVWSVDTAPDREWSSIGLAARSVGRGRIFGEVIKHELGTSWVVDAMVKLRAMFGGNLVVLDGAGSASSLGRDLEDEGFEVRRLSSREKVDACGALFDDVLDGQFVHLPDPEDLDPSLQAAAKRNVGAGEGGFMWVRGRSLKDITPLYTVTLARHVLREQLGDDYDTLESTM
ncbi:MAG: hypothetical protein ACYC1Z_03440 [Georgenia sp.]